MRYASCVRLCELNFLCEGRRGVEGEVAMFDKQPTRKVQERRATSKKMAEQNGRHRRQEHRNSWRGFFFLSVVVMVIKEAVVKRWRGDGEEERERTGGCERAVTAPPSV